MDQENAMNKLYERVQDLLPGSTSGSLVYSPQSLADPRLYTAYKVLKGHDYVGELLPLGETVMGKFPRVKDTSAPRWIKGIYVGKTSNSEEHLLMTE